MVFFLLGWIWYWHYHYVVTSVVFTGLCITWCSWLICVVDLTITLCSWHLYWWLGCWWLELFQFNEERLFLFWVDLVMRYSFLLSCWRLSLKFWLLSSEICYIKFVFIHLLYDEILSWVCKWFFSFIPFCFLCSWGFNFPVILWTNLYHSVSWRNFRCEILRVGVRCHILVDIKFVDVLGGKVTGSIWIGKRVGAILISGRFSSWHEVVVDFIMQNWFIRRINTIIFEFIPFSRN